MESMLVNEASFRALAATLSRSCRRTSLSTSATQTNSPRSPVSTCIVAASRWRSGHWIARSTTSCAAPIFCWCSKAVTDADNVGSAFRNAAAFGASVVLNDACCDPLYRKAIRTSMGSVLRTPYARMRDWPHGPAGTEERRIHCSWR